MSKNIGFTKKEAEALAKMMDVEWEHVEAYAQKEERVQCFSGRTVNTHEYIVVLRKRRDK